ncbi:MAG: undecaprenyl/decaprenyl-phosphate alpha-N-acetylglucosaminyl 1-phosphate transferase [Candidatus Margulisbacteria bacterium]|nr:undecaprenyl/decaprenyl-phosphate alpha-N-acetylglucosaminyl 1-phosphate transferase [Candidatus Margulisiibacteriota bacterium]MBU1021417.1 undecaprenyl/decaprenyl-phosphate alpha-N-acetylglucosaminyl 1-phosphate transferase [Candidatus Margulisiibacteriota bacterium]MBU1728338.1 undecaprenyl/decaprenyl-phosphate alpha-N-acetylglucosaminyl 1-phosphate transferase [Candidatus Margulisiibacteriota bacterium]MBU1955919.1 undecaprenyl/decaprenyl-phosphate alpha-N-acetylglucosaminyl 1-phosphate t
MLVFFLIFAVALLTTIVFTPLASKLAHIFGAIDHPNERKIHANDIPRMGGFSIFIGFIFAAGVAIACNLLGILHFDLVLFSAIVAAAFIILGLGIADDIWDIRPEVKLVCQIIAASLVISFGASIDFISNPFNGLVYLSAFAFPITLFWIVGITNSINLLDGLDGLAAGVVGISSAALFFVSLIKGQSEVASVILLVLSGVSFGFLFFNFNPASIFLGDSGSYLLGFLLAVASVIGALKSTLFVVFIIPILILAVPILDTALAILRRIFLRKHIFQADGEHIHHRLLAAGFSHRGAVLAIYICCIILSLIALVLITVL